MKPHPLLFAVAVGLGLLLAPQSGAQSRGSAAVVRTPTVHRAPRPLAADAVTADWPDFLGPGRDGVCAETRLERNGPKDGPRLVWEVPAGSGYASPSVAGDRLIYFHRLGDEEVVECRHPETGELRWEHRHPTSYEDSYGFSNGPRCSPVIEEDRVWTYGAEGVLTCLAVETGKVVWTRSLNAEFAVPQDFFGVVSTPLLHGDLLIVHLGAPEGPAVIALAARTGETRWESTSPWRAGYSSPVVAAIHGRDRLFVFAGGKSRPPSGGLTCLDPATGEVDFEFPFRSRSFESVNAACPVVIGDQVYVSASYGTGGALLDILEDGTYRTAWTSAVLGTHFNTAIHRDGFLYGFDGRNEADAALVCQDLATGREAWREVLAWEDRVEVRGEPRVLDMGVYRGMLIQVDGDFLCLGEQGHLLWLDLQPSGCKVLARYWLFAARETWTPPVIHQGLVYVCQNDRDFLVGTAPRLLCYDLRAAQD